MKKTLLIVLFAVFSLSGIAQTDKYWTKASTVSEVAKNAQRESFPSDFTLYQLNVNAFKQAVSSAPDRFSGLSGTIITIPNANGKMERFEVFEASNFAPELQAQYPEIRAYIGIGLDDKKAQVRFSIDNSGLQAMTFRAGQRTEFMEPYAADGSAYAFYVSSRTKGKMPFTCATVDHNVASDMLTNRNINETQASNGVLKTFRLALSCTGEYGVFHGGTVAGALAAMNATITRVNGVFERDLAVRLNIIANNSAVVYTNPATDPYSPATGINNWNSQLQTTLTNVIGEANYDVGHLFGATGGGGNAGCIGCVCVDGIKGSGITSPADGVPAGDLFDIDYVAHELGHQFGANHTFSHQVEGTGVNIEPGSGSTVMGYAGITDFNVQNNSDDYFAYRSILQIQTNLLTKTCPTNTTLTNPAITITSGGNWTIPQGTAFVLTGTNPTNNPGVTFNWEQNNNANNSVTGENSVCFPTKAVGPNFRSVIPSSTPVRFMPAFSSVLNGQLSTTWESVSTIQRTLNFTLTARDNIANGGQTSTTNATITVSATVGPFAITSQNTDGISWDQGTSQTITWSVNGTTSLAGSANVDILLSTDAGQTFSTVLAANTPNDGTETITVPDVAAPFCRIMIRPTANIYYAVNSKAFAIGYTVTNTCNTYTFNTPFAIPDNGTTFTTRTINVPENVTISDVNVGVNLTHTYIADILFAVLSPANTQIDLFSRQCGSNDNLNVTFDDSGAPILCATPTQGTYAPFESLSGLNGQSSAGNWIFGFNDNFPEDTGNVNSFFIQICSQQVTLSTPNYGFDDFVVYPNPSNGNFTVQFSNATQSEVKLAVHDMRGRLVMEKTYEGGNSFSQNIQLDNAQSGVYLLSVTDGERKEVKRIVVN